MTLEQLSPEQITELKQRWLVEIGVSQCSYEMLANADNIVSMAQLKNMYEGINFVDEDFFCTSHKNNFHNTKNSKQ